MADILSQKTSEVKRVLGMLITEKGVGNVTDSTETAEALAKLSGIDSTTFKRSDDFYMDRTKKIAIQYRDPTGIKNFEDIVNKAFLDVYAERKDVTYDDTMSEEVKEDPEILKKYNKRFTEASLRCPNQPRIYDEQRVAVMDDEFQMDMPVNTSMTRVACVVFHNAFPTTAKETEETEGRQYKFKIKIMPPDQNAFVCRWRIIIRW